MIHGTQVSSTVIDEAGSLTLDMVRAMVKTFDLSVAGARIIPATDVPCSVCEADAGEPCLPIRRQFNWSGGRHTERMLDALTVSTAVQALDPQPKASTLSVGDIVTVAGKKYVVV